MVNAFEYDGEDVEISAVIVDESAFDPDVSSCVSLLYCMFIKLSH